jgi:transposase
VKEQRHYSRSLVADSKLYSEGTAETLNKINFITRVPATIKAEQEYISRALQQKNEWLPLDNGYKSQEFPSSQYGIENQRWIVYYSDQAHDRSKKTLDKEVKKEAVQIQKDLSSLGKKQFGCEADAHKALNAIAKKWRYHLSFNAQTVSEKQYTGRGRPTADTAYTEVYHISAEFNFNQASFDATLHQRSCFVLATNVSQEKSDQGQILKAYKGQDHTEKGFAFLKKPEFFTSSLNLEKPGRIEAILMIMVLSLLIYSLAQRRLRNALIQSKETIPDQLKKPTNNPTMRWVFQLFEGVDLIIANLDPIKKTFIQGLNETRKKIVSLLGGNI